MRTRSELPLIAVLSCLVFEFALAEPVPPAATVKPVIGQPLSASPTAGHPGCTQRVGGIPNRVNWGRFPLKAWVLTYWQPLARICIVVFV